MLKQLLNSHAKEIADLKSMIKSMAKEVLSTKDTSKKTESITSHLASLHFLTRQIAPKTNPSIALISFVPKSVAFPLQIALDLSQSESKSIQKLFVEIQQIFHASISGSQVTECINIKDMNKVAKRKPRYFVFFHTPENKARVRVNNK